MNTPFQEKVEFLTELARTLHRYGTPAYRLETCLMSVSQKLGIQSAFFALPTSILASFKVPAASLEDASGNPYDNEISRLIRVQPGEVDLEKLVEVDRVADQVLANEFS